MIFDPLYLVLMLPVMAFALWASARTRSAFTRWSKVPARIGQTGNEVARRLLQNEGISLSAGRAGGGEGLRMERIAGALSDHYDPQHRALRLSESVFDSHSVAALGVAAHECGHALQDHLGYGPLKWRQVAAPAAGFASQAWIWLFFGGFLLPGLGHTLMTLALVCLVVYAGFAILTLPVEFDASRRALVMLETSRTLTSDELAGAKQVLDAAALTYVASAAQAVMLIIYVLMRRN